MLVASFSSSVDVLQGALALGDFIEDLQHPACAHPAGGTLAAGLVYGELEEELCDIHHAVVFVQNDHAAGAHHGADLAVRLS